MNDKLLLYLMIGVGGAFGIILIIFMILKSKMNKTSGGVKQVKQASTSGQSMEVLYQKLYVKYIKIPFIKRYVFKLRRRLEIINIGDEYMTRKQASKSMTRMLMLIIPIIVIILLVTKGNMLLRTILLLAALVLLETMIDGMADKIDNKLLKQQIDFFAEIRHAYHEFNMVEEAIYQVAQDNEVEVSRQAEYIYEVLISSDPESELEKYYDIAPNDFLKEFAGISYLTKEFGDREDERGASLYLKNLGNITQEMQIEILKRDKLDYVFQSLSVIAALPILFLEPIKNWSISQFAFTKSFYNGKTGLIIQIAIILITFICYILTRKLKDNGGTDKNTKNMINPWQAKLYKNPALKNLIDLFLPKKGTKEYRSTAKLLKDSAAKTKMEWFYINRMTIAFVTFIVSFVFFVQLHRISIDYIYTEPTTDYDIIGEMSARDQKKAMDITQKDNYFLDMFRGKVNTTKPQIMNSMRYSPYYIDASDEDLNVATERVYKKLQVINGENLQWFEILFAFVFTIAGYMTPVWLLKFQYTMRQMEMENEVMLFHTIIMMLMKIERVSVEIILEWLERYANIFKEPISKCVNNYESGPWEALEQMKEDVSYQMMIRIVESLQAAVEKIPIRQAFDELDTERDYYQQRRKDANERLISKKGMIGKAIGFAPMVILFVGYLIVPLVFIGFQSMSSSMNTMQSMK